MRRASYSGWAEDVCADVSDTETERVYVEPQQLAQLLGWFSIGLGLTEILECVTVVMKP